MHLQILLFSKKLRAKALQMRYIIHFVIFKETKSEITTDGDSYVINLFLFSRKIRAKQNRHVTNFFLSLYSYVVLKYEQTISVIILYIYSSQFWMILSMTMAIRHTWWVDVCLKV